MLIFCYFLNGPFKGRIIVEGLCRRAGWMTTPVLRAKLGVAPKLARSYRSVATSNFSSIEWGNER